MLAPRLDGRRGSSGGLLVEATILARLLRIRLLRLEATIVIVPAEADARAPAVVVRSAPSRAPSPPAPLPAWTAPGGRGGLARARRTLEEGAAILEDVRPGSGRLRR